MRYGTFRRDAGDLQRDCIGLVDTDPDGQVAVCRLFLEDDHVLPGWHVHPNAVDGHLDQVGHAWMIAPPDRIYSPSVAP